MWPPHCRVAINRRFMILWWLSTYVTSIQRSRYGFSEHYVRLICAAYVWKVRVQEKREFSKRRAFNTPNKCPRSVSQRMIFLNCVRSEVPSSQEQADVDHNNSPSRRSGTRSLHQSNLIIAGDITLARNLIASSAKSGFFLFYRYVFILVKPLRSIVKLAIFNFEHYIHFISNYLIF